MGQVTVNLDDELEQKLRMAAESIDLSESCWIAKIIEEKLQDEWPPSVQALAGSWKDFPSTEAKAKGVT
ncbi:MAG: CopG family transcriptional regulator [Chloroflexota bacterium]